jgi:hypothetical protein
MWQWFFWQIAGEGERDCAAGGRFIHGVSRRECLMRYA